MKKEAKKSRATVPFNDKQWSKVVSVNLPSLNCSRREYVLRKICPSSRARQKTDMLFRVFGYGLTLPMSVQKTDYKIMHLFIILMTQIVLKFF
jgi:hypothetical protein